MTSLTLIRRIAARPALVFDALTTAEGIAAWWGPDDLPVLKVQVDARIGGGYRIRFQTLDGREHEVFGEYLEVDPPRRLVMTWRYAFGGEPVEGDATSRIEVEIAPLDGGAELTFTHSGLKNPTSVASHTHGWTGSLAKLVSLFNAPRKDPR